MIIKVSNRITLLGLPRFIKTEVMSRLSFKNPKFIEAKAHGRPTWKIRKYLKYFEETSGGDLIIPRGFIRQLLSLCKERGVPFSIVDRRRSLPEVDFSFKSELREYQKKAATDIMARDSGTASMPTGSGKTVLALHVVAQRKQPVLVIVHTKELAHQWISRAKQFLGLSDEQIGLVGDGRVDIGRPFTVGIINSVYRYAEDLKPTIGFLIVDECHRCPSRTFSEAVCSFDSKFLLGLSATVFRRDKLSKLIFWYCGNLVHKIKKRDLEKTEDIVGIEVVQRETQFQTRLNPSEQYTAMISELCADTARSQLIVNDIIKESRTNQNTLLVLSDRKSHDDIKALLRTRGMPCDLLTGSVPAKQRESIVQKLEDGEVRVLLSTTQLLSEGFDSNRLGTLFLASPVRFSGRVTQIIGRLLRPGHGKKKAVIFDYIDSLVGPLQASAEARQRVYNGGN